MNQKFQNIIEIIQQSEKLDAEQKNNLIKAVKDSDKELEITAFKLERTEKVKKTTAILLEETIEELEQKRKAIEAQNRELEIEAALERVRAVAMSMKKPADMVEVCKIISEQLGTLGVKDIRNIQTVIINEKNGTYLNYQYFTAYGKGSIEETECDKHPKVLEMVHAMKRSTDAFFGGTMEGEELKIFRDYRKQDNQFPDPLLGEASIVQYNFYSIGLGGLGITSYKKLPDSAVEIFKRFHKVFTLAYSRFKDIQQAEAQAREAQVEAALERIRSRALGMHHSSEVKEVSNLLFSEFEKMNINLSGFNIIVFDKNRDNFEMWRAKQVAVPNEFESFSHKNLYDKLNQYLPGFVAEFESEWKNGKPYYLSRFTGEKRISFLKANSEIYNYSDEQLEKMKELYTDPIIWYMVFFKLGWLGLICNRNLSENELLVSHRFAEVFEFAYTRFLDIQKAEAQAREAIKQASMDRVRGEIASMRTAEDLNRITPIIWHELKALEVPFIRCGVFIFDEEQEKTLVYLTTPEGKSLGVLNLSFNANELTTNTVEYWKKKQVYKEHWDKEEFINWIKSMMELGQVQNAETYQGSSTPPESLHLHFVPFAQGMLYVGDVSPLADEKLELVKTLAEAFSIAYARYEDFKNLEEAKNKIELTLNELKAAQAQLIHSEKMASLGELTAGIAHEIKNPLNFVNNFSEISGELLDEIKEELDKNDKEEVLAILGDLKQNLEKINQHGKRADSIVKGMLLHSRGSSGEKILADINELLEQYVNLAYHGMRAQNKEFNIAIEKDYDETLEKINVVPQDISRVFLNIINNACYAAYDRKKKSTENNFSPALKVSTKNLNGKVEIRIGDNGNGIPENILDKIFQPFFTTKPTGEGTGLGLSLSYDIITKVHGGELRVETKEGEGTEFIILLTADL